MRFEYNINDSVNHSRFMSETRSFAQNNNLIKVLGKINLLKLLASSKNNHTPKSTDNEFNQMREVVNR